MRPNTVYYEENPVFEGRLKDNEVKFCPWFLGSEDNRSKFGIILLKYSEYLRNRREQQLRYQNILFLFGK